MYAFDRLKEIDTHCGETYGAYKKALKKNWHQIDETRKEQAALENCWREFKQYNKVRSRQAPWVAGAFSRSRRLTDCYRTTGLDHALAKESSRWERTDKRSTAGALEARAPLAFALSFCRRRRLRHHRSNSLQETENESSQRVRVLGFYIPILLHSCSRLCS